MCVCVCVCVKQSHVFEARQSCCSKRMWFFCRETPELLGSSKRLLFCCRETPEVLGSSKRMWLGCGKSPEVLGSSQDPFILITYLTLVNGPVQSSVSLSLSLSLTLTFFPSSSLYHCLSLTPATPVSIPLSVSPSISLYLISFPLSLSPLLSSPLSSFPLLISPLLSSPIFFSEVLAE